MFISLMYAATHTLFYFLDGRQKFKVTAAYQLSDAMHTSRWQNIYWFVHVTCS